MDIDPQGDEIDDTNRWDRERAIQSYLDLPDDELFLDEDMLPYYVQNSRKFKSRRLVSFVQNNANFNFDKFNF